jgi:surfactin synthase thioesterase subunit
VKIFSFHFAGGNKYSFNRILNISQNSIGIEADREDNLALNELSLKNVEMLKIYLNPGERYVLYGHSMGALVGYLVCHKLKKLGIRGPEKLVVSGKKAPPIPRDKIISNLPDQEFWNEIVTFGGIPNEIENYPELIDYYLPIFRHDFRLVESYQYEKKDKLNIPIDVFYGSEEATEEDMLSWQDETTEEVRITQLEGNHFFIFDHIDYFKRYFNNIIFGQ